MASLGHLGVTAANLPQELTVDLALSGGFAITLSQRLDYSPALSAAADAFEALAQALVPVRTGALQASIHADNDGMEVRFYADADYASYVEYGTWKMPAQSFYEPGAGAAEQVFMEIQEQIVEQATEELMARVASYNMNGGAIDALQDQIMGQAASLE